MSNYIIISIAASRGEFDIIGKWITCSRRKFENYVKGHVEDLLELAKEDFEENCDEDEKWDDVKDMYTEFIGHTVIDVAKGVACVETGEENYDILLSRESEWFRKLWLLSERTYGEGSEGWTEAIWKGLEEYVREWNPQ